MQTSLSYIILIMAAIAICGCTSRQPIGTLKLQLNLNKLEYKDMASTDGESSIEYSAIIEMISSNGSLTYTDVPEIGFSLTEEINLIGLKKLNLKQISFTKALKWGENILSIPILYPENILVISGNGPSGNIQRYVGEIAYGNDAEIYEI